MGNNPNEKALKGKSLMIEGDLLSLCSFCIDCCKQVSSFCYTTTDSAAAVASGAETAEATDPAAQVPVRAGARPAGRDVLDPVPKERGDGARQVPAEGCPERPEPAVPGAGQTQGPAQGVPGSDEADGPAERHLPRPLHVPQTRVQRKQRIHH